MEVEVWKLSGVCVCVCVCVFVVFTGLITADVSCARSQDSFVGISDRDACHISSKRRSLISHDDGIVLAVCDARMALTLLEIFTAASMAVNAKCRT